MPQHLSAYYEDVDQNGALLPIAAVPDQSVTIQGDDVRVPIELPFIIGEVAMTAAATITAAQLQSPSLRATANIDIEPLVDGVVFGNPPESLMHPNNPIAIKGDEALTMHMNTDDAAAEIHYGLVWLSDGRLQSVEGDIISIGATSAITLVAGQWENGSLTFNQDLPVGRYSIVGMRARGTNLVAARLVGIGSIWRPGVPAVNAISDIDNKKFRYGMMGVYLEFHTNTPPKMDCLGVTDVAQNYIFDIIRL